MKKRNIAKIIWISSIFLELIVILIMVMDYKIHYQYLKINKLYFYECMGTLCVTEVKDNDHLLYSSYNCGYEECPTYRKELNDTYVILTEKKATILYNYRTGATISRDYEDYQLINNNYFIITKNNTQGIIDNQNHIIVSPSYDQLGLRDNDYLSGYNLNSIIAKKENKYGIISFKTGNVIEPINYEKEDIDTLLNILKKETAE